MCCFNFFRNQLWQHLISYNSFRNMKMCLLEVAMCGKCRSNYFQSEGGVKSLRTGGGLKILGLELPIWAGLLLLGGGVSTLLHAMIPPTLQRYMEIRLFATLLLKLKHISENIYCKLQVKNLYAHWSEKKITL